jgi:simple sugar transport system substrate-binding protein
MIDGRRSAMMKRFLVVFLVLLLGMPLSMLFATGTQDGAASAAKQSPKYTFYAVGVDPGIDPFWATVYKGLKSAELYFPVKIVYAGMRGDQLNATGIANILETGVVSKPDGLITGFWFLEASDEIVRRGIKNGIPVIAYNQLDPRPEGERIPYLGYVGMDDRVTGEALAKAMLSKMKIKRAAIGIQYPGSAPLEMRASGIIKALNAAGIPNDKLDITEVPATAQTVLGSYLTKYPETNVLFLLGPVGTHPAISLIQDRGLKGKVAIATFDMSDKTLQAIKDGIVEYSIVQQAAAQGFIAVQELYLYLEYGIIPPERVDTGPTLVDSSVLKIIEKQMAKTGGS